MDIREKINLQLGENFFKEEVRCEFLVTEKTKKIWAIQLDLLNELIRVCEKHKIKMCVWAGTLLGTVRHKGMIPWDDDIDVCLSREEYEKLCKIALYEFKHPYFFQNYKTDPQYLIGYSRLRNSLTTGFILDNESLNYNNGIYIDIFVLDGYTGNEKLLHKQMRNLNCLVKLYNSINRNVYSKNCFKLFIKRAVSAAIHLIPSRLVNNKLIIDAYERNLQKYSDSTDKISLITHELFFIKRYWAYKQDLENIEYMPFENIKVPVPVNYDEVLAHMYGNYMEFPPVAKRGVWHEGILEFDPDTPYKEYIKKRNK